MTYRYFGLFFNSHLGVKWDNKASCPPFTTALFSRAVAKKSNETEEVEGSSDHTVVEGSSDHSIDHDRPWLKGVVTILLCGIWALLI
jgi:hypothetical protein